MECIYNFETNQTVIIIDFLKKLIITEHLYEDKINKLINSIKEHNKEILDKIDNLLITKFDFRTHLNSLVNFIKMQDSINLKYNSNEVCMLIDLIEKDYEIYWKNLTL